MTTFVRGAGVNIRGLKFPEEDFSAAIVETPRTYPDQVVPYTDRDFNYIGTVSTNQHNDFDVHVVESPVHGGYDIVISGDPVASVDGRSVAHAGSASGYINVDVHTPIGSKRIATGRHMAGGFVQAEVRSFTSFNTGCLGKHCADTIDTLVAGVTAGSDSQRLWDANNYTPGAPSATPNPNMWARSIDFSALSIMSSGGSNWVSGCLVSPRHIISATHYANADNSPNGPIVWRDTAGNYYTANIVSRANVNNSLESDITISYLSAAIPIPPMRIMPTDWLFYLPCVSQNRARVDIPVVQKGLHIPGGTGATGMEVNRARMGILAYYQLTPDYNFHAGGAFDILDVPRKASWAAFYAAPNPGDSSSPVMAIVNGAPILLHTIWYQGGAGSMLSEFSTPIETAMNSLAAAAGDNTQYSLLRANLSMFTKYT